MVLFDVRRMVLLLLLLPAGCVWSKTATDQQARYRAAVGRSETELTQSFGQPTRRESIEGHEFLIYEQSDVWSGAKGWSMVAIITARAPRTWRYSVRMSRHLRRGGRGSKRL
jgi:hypothetical protein